MLTAPKTKLHPETPRYRIEFSLFTKHATGSWKGNRIVLSAYTTLRANEITTQDRNYLKTLGPRI